MNGYKIKFNPDTDQKTPVLKLVINDVDTIEAFLDTGYPGFIQTNKKYTYDKIKTNNPEFIVHSYSKETEFEKLQKKRKDTKAYSSFVKINSLKIGDYEVKNTLIYSEENYEGQNLIGTAFLENFNFTIDWINSDVYLSPIENKKPVSNISTYGFNCSKKDEKLIVTVIYLDSDVYKAGIKIGDEIIAINDELLDEGKLDLKKIINDRNSISPSEKVIKIKFKNKNEECIYKKYEIY
jgi:hypothetical protein